MELGVGPGISRILFTALPGYSPKKPRRRHDRWPETAPPLSFEAFTEHLLVWAQWWNTEHRPAELHGATPLEAWQADPTPLNDVPRGDVWTFTLEDDVRPRTVTSHGVRFRNRDSIAGWMTGQAGLTVTVTSCPTTPTRSNSAHPTASVNARRCGSGLVGSGFGCGGLPVDSVFGGGCCWVLAVMG